MTRGAKHSVKGGKSAKRGAKGAKHHIAPKTTDPRMKDLPLYLETKEA